MSHDHCTICGCDFPSRNKLFKHLKLCTGTTTPPPPPSKGRAFIYSIGGRVRGQTLHSCERLQIGSATWEKTEPLLEARGSHGACSVGNKIYAIGGGGFRSNLSTCECFDTETGNWTEIATMGSCRHALSVVAVPSAQTFYADGGWVNGNECSKLCERYDCKSNTWSFCSPMQHGRRLMGATVCKGYIYCFGGSGAEGSCWHSDVIERYELSSDTWTVCRCKLPKSGETSAVAVEGYIYVFIHGHGCWRFDTETEEFVFTAMLPLKEWFTFSTVVDPLCPQAIYLIGGASCGRFSKECWKYCCVTHTFSPVPGMTRARRRVAVAAVSFS